MEEVEEEEVETRQPQFTPDAEDMGENALPASKPEASEAPSMREHLAGIFHSWWYRALFVSVLLLNTVMLCFFSRTSRSLMAELSMTSEPYFLAFWGIDIVLRVGLQGLRVCMRDHWFGLEVVVTVLSLLTFALQKANFGGLRALLLLRYLPQLPFLGSSKVLLDTFRNAVTNFFMIYVM